MLDMFHLARNQMVDAIPLDEQIDFIFDYQDEKKTILSIWDEYIKARPDEAKKYYGTAPRFEDDEKFLPLQSADLWAWWVRKWYNEGTPEKIKAVDFSEFNIHATRKHLKIEITFDEVQLVKIIKRTLREQIDADHSIYDVKFS